MLTANEVAKRLNVSLAWVYKHKKSLCAFQASNGCTVRYPEKVIEEIERGVYAVQDEKREIQSNSHDKWEKEERCIHNVKRSEKMGTGANRRSVGKPGIADPFKIFV